MFERLLPSALCRRYMTDLGKEIEEALQSDAWHLDEYTLKHKSSGLQLWISNGYPYFKIYRAARIDDEKVLKPMLNRWDRCVLWRLHKLALDEFHRAQKAAKVNEVLNTLRLGRIKEHGGTP